MDIKHSLTYFMKQEDWKKNYAILIGAMLLGIIPFIGTIISSILYVGYLLVLTNHRIFKPEIPLVQWDTGKILKTGGKFFIPCIVFVLFNMFLPNMFFKGSTFSLSSILFILVIYIVLMIFYDVILLVFATNLKIASMLNMRAIKFILIDNLNEYIKFSLIRFVLLLGLSVVYSLTAITLIGPLLLFPSLLFVVADLNAQFIRKIFKINTKQIQG